VKLQQPFGDRWFVHTERRAYSEKERQGTQEPIFYTDEQRSQIEAGYDQQYLRGPDTLYIVDCVKGHGLPRMVKGPLTITDMINTYMGIGWITYSNPPFCLAYENRKRLRGFYSLNEVNWWDTTQRVHWDRELAQSVGVRQMYDIGPMRYMMLCHYLTNFAGDDAWTYGLRYELRNFNYVGGRHHVAFRRNKERARGRGLGPGCRD